MKNISIKIIAADLDGTLLNDSHELPKGFFELVRKMHGMGIIFAAASGRQYQGLENLFEPVKNEMAFIAENGGAVFYQGKCICSLPMPDSAVCEMIKAAQGVWDKGVRLLLSGEKGAYAADSDPDFADHCSRYCARTKTVSDLTAFMGEDRILKAALFSPDSEKITYPAVKRFENEFSVTVSGTRWVDIVSKKATKGSALKILMERFGAGFEEVMAFGDYLNDLELMSCCKYSFAMENAHPRLKEAAAYTAPSNNENGVVKEILRLIPQLAE